MAYTTIDKPGNHFKATAYTGDGSTSNEITTGHQPDFVWIKNLDATADNQWQDSARGKSGSNYQYLQSNTNIAQAAQSDDDGVNTLGSNSFTVGYTDSAGWNQNTVSYSGLSWKCNGGTEVSNTDGSITSTVQVNSTNGFSMVKYTGTGSSATIGHGLGAKPDFIISKIYSTTGDWNVYHDNFALNERIKLNSTGAKTTNTSIFAALPTSTVISVGNGGDINTSSGNHIFYCWKSVPGFSKFGYYVGNGSATGPYQNIGFKPACLIIKRIDTAADWLIFDVGRDTDNVIATQFRPSSSAAQDSPYEFYDFMANGFRNKNSATDKNASGGTYIFAAWAESPFVSSGGVAGTAR